MRDRMQAYWLRHPRLAALFIALLGVGVPAIDSSRLHDAATRYHVDWRSASAVGATVGLVGLGFIVGFYLSLRPMGERALRRGGLIGAVLVVLAFGITHPRNGPDAIGDWTSLMLVVAVDTAFMLGLLCLAPLVWRRPVPDFEAVANTRARHGPRWKRRSAARHPGRPGGR